MPRTTLRRRVLVPALLSGAGFAVLACGLIIADQRRDAHERQQVVIQSLATAVRVAVEQASDAQRIQRQLSGLTRQPGVIAIVVAEREPFRTLLLVEGEQHQHLSETALRQPLLDVGTGFSFHELADGIEVGAVAVTLPNGRPGAVAVLFDGRHASNGLHREVAVVIIFILALLAATLAMVLWLVETRIMGRLQRLLQAIDRRRTDPQARIPTESDDEIAAVGMAINSALTGHEVQTRQLIEQQARLQVVMDTAVDAIAVIDEQGRIETWNRSAERLFGWKAEEAIGLNISMVMPPPHAQAHDGYLERYLVDGIRRVVGTTRELEACSRVGRRFPIELTVNETRIDGRIRFTGFIRDITQRKEAQAMLSAASADAAMINQQLQQAIEEAHTANQAKSDFLASMSHEIRTPMNGVIGMSNLLADTRLSPEQQEYVQAIRLSGEALLTLINDILDFSKIEAGKMTIEPVPFDLCGACEDVLELLSTKAVEKDLDLVLDWSSETPTRVIGDPGRIRQILINLVGNAIKFTSKGGVSIRVRSGAAQTARQSTAQPGHPLIRIEVQDTGIGLTPSQRDKLFSPFMQADASTTRKYGGTGLGLAICKRLVELMDGEIGVDSEPGRGSTFRVEMPLPIADQRESPPALDTLIAVRALVITDLSISQNVLANQLRGWGMTVDEEVDPNRSIDRLLAAIETGAIPDLVVIDLHGRSGEALGMRLRAEPGLTGCQLVLLVSVGLRGDAQRLAEAGFAAYLTKPLRNTVLARAIRQVLANRGQPGAPLVTRHSAAEHQRSTNDTDRHARPTGKRWRILVAEDNHINQRVVSKLLERAGCVVDLAGNGLEAVEQASSRAYDLLLMDCQMPEMDGYQATAAIRGKRSLCQQIPIIALTANAMAGDRERCLDAGMNDHLAKPITGESLRACLARWLVDSSTSAVAVIPESPTIPPPIIDEPDTALDALERELGDRTVVVDIARDFLEQVPALLARLDRTSDPAAIGKQLHQLKGMLKNMRLEQSATAVTQAETLALAGTRPDLAGLRRAVEPTLARLAQAL